MHKKQRVADMATAVLTRQVEARVERTGEPFEEALKAVLETEAGRQLGELRDGPHRDERAQNWQKDLVRERAQDRKRERAEKRSRAQRAPRRVAWSRRGFLIGMKQEGVVDHVEKRRSS